MLELRPTASQKVSTSSTSAQQIHPAFVQGHGRTHIPSIPTRRQSPSKQIDHYCLCSNLLISAAFYPFYYPSKLLRHELSSLSHTGLVAFRRRSFARRLIAVTRVPEGASPRILVSPVALHRSVKVETFLLQHSPPPTFHERLFHFHKQVCYHFRQNRSLSVLICRRFWPFRFPHSVCAGWRHYSCSLTSLPHA